MIDALAAGLLALGMLGQTGTTPGRLTIFHHGKINPPLSRPAIDAVAPPYPVLPSSWFGHGTSIKTRAISMVGLSLTEPDPPGGEPRTTLNVAVTVAGDVPPAVIESTLRQASKIWATGGLTIVRRPVEEADVHLIFEMRPTNPAKQVVPLGWIDFDDDVPRNVIHVSYGNALQLVEDWRAVNGGGELSKPWAAEMATGRALGRALAHEVGHYILASKVHAKTGLMSARQTARDLFSAGGSGFLIDSDLRMMVAERMCRLSSTR